MRLSTCLSSVCLILALGCAEFEPESVGRNEQAIEGGSDDVVSDSISQARRDATVLLFSRSGACSATLVTPRLVLTAAHCTRTSEQWIAFGPLDQSGRLRRADLRRRS